MNLILFLNREDEIYFDESGAYNEVMVNFRYVLEMEDRGNSGCKIHYANSGYSFYVKETYKEIKEMLLK